MRADELTWLLDLEIIFPLVQAGILVLGTGTWRTIAFSVAGGHVACPTQNWRREEKDCEKWSGWREELEREII